MADQRLHRPDDSGGPIDVRTLLELRTWTAFDVDNAGRVLAGHDGSGSVQLVEIATDGRRTPLTALPGPCSGRYVVGERAVVVQHDDAGNELAQLSLLRLDEQRADPAGLDDLVPLVRDEAHLHTLVDVLPGAVVYATNRRNGVDFDVVMRRLDTGEETVVYDAGGYVADTAVAADGRAVVTLHSLQPASTQVWLSAPGVGLRALTDADEHAMHVGASLLPGSGDVVMSSNSGREHLAVVCLAESGVTKVLVEADDHDVVALPSPDGRRLLVVHNVDGGHALALHDPDGHLRLDVPLPARGIVTPVWSADSRSVVVGLVAPTDPGTLLLLAAATGSLRTVVSAAEQMVPALGAALVEPTSYRVPARDGEQIPCFVYAPREKPAGPLAGSVVVTVHGGPEAQAQRVFNPVVQALVSAGHTVLVPNVRGSTGYGKRWYSLDDGRLRLESVADLADLRAWVPAVDGDPERVALYGGSYGGYLVLAGLSMQPESWAAGVDVVGMSSLVTFLENTAPYRRAIREREYGWLDRDLDFLQMASPLTYLDAMASPLLVIHGANDPRVPLSESQQIKAALDAKDVPCTLLVYTDEGHGLAKRANRLDAYPQVLDFLGAHLAG
ncbi:MAG: S9 family peptidase [Nocardioidaceae bacterium]